MFHENKTSGSEELVVEIEKFIRDFKCDYTNLSQIKNKSHRFCDSTSDLIAILDSESQSNTQNTKLKTPHGKSKKETNRQLSQQSATHSTMNSNGLEKRKRTESKTTAKESSIKNYKIPKVNGTKTKADLVSKKHLEYPEKNVPLKKRKLEPNPEELPSKKSKQKKSDSSRKLHKSKTSVLKPGVYQSCKEFSSPEKKRVQYVEHSVSRKKAKVSHVKCCNDSTIIRIPPTIQVKQEVIDLTGEETTFFAFLKFPLITHIELEDTKPILFPTAQATVSYVEGPTDEAVVLVADVQCHVDDAIVDLTESVDEDDTIVVVSEKECASRILHYVYNVHRITEANKTVINIFKDIEDCISPVESKEDVGLSSQLMAKHVAHLSSNFRYTISKLFVKNLDMSRFLNILGAKLDLKFNLMLNPTTIGVYLLQLFDKNNKSYFGNQLAQDMVEQLEVYLKTSEMKSEHYHEDFHFSASQLIELRRQINEYCRLTQQLGQFGVEDKIPVSGFFPMNREMKEEILSLHGGEFLHNRYIC